MTARARRPEAADERPLIFVTVGTDHHPFDRLVRWMDAWVAGTEGVSARCLVQRGTSGQPELAESVAYVGAGEMASLLQQATVVVTHGGAATLTECIRLGIIPVVVPRRKELGEHVDDHQVSFVERMAREGACVTAATEEELSALLERALADPGSMRVTPREPVSPEAVGRFGELVEGMVEAKRGRTSHASLDGRPRAGKVRVLFVGGWGRSGSTLLARILGQVPGYVLAGEVREIWARLSEDRPCGCGVTIRSCPFWSAVGRRAFGGWDAVDLGRLEQIRLKLDRPWSMPMLLAIRGRGTRPMREYVEALGRVYRAIADESGGDTVVDASKIPTHALLARRVPGLDLRVVHLVRDSRGVAFSWQKHMIWPDAAGGRKMLRFGAFSAGIRYLVYNVQTHVLRSLGHPYVLVRYEDIVASPSTELSRIFGTVGEGVDPSELPLSDGGVRLGVDHTADGNPMRFETGDMRLKLDEAWREKLSPKDRIIISAMTAPLLRRYAYSIRPGRERRALRRR